MIYWKNFDFKKRCDVATVGDKQNRLYYNGAFSFDIETSKTDIGGEPVSFMYIWQFGINGTAVYGRTWAEFLEFLTAFKKWLGNGKADRHTTAVIYVHNLAYEFAFVAPYLPVKTVFARSPHHPIYFKVEGGFEFRCSYMLTGKSLADVSTSTSVKKLVGDLDYSLIRHYKTPLTKTELAYCENDVLILCEYIAREIKNCGDITQIPLTKTGYVRREVLQAFQASSTWAEYQRNLRFTYPKLPVFALLNKSFSGGFTHANCDYVGLTLYRVASYDLASSYPTQMIKHKYPSGNWINLKEIADRDTLKKMCKNYACIMEITYKNLQAKTSHHTISRHKCSIADNAVIDNGRIVSGDFITTYITSVDFNIIDMFYTYDAIQVHQFYYSKLEYLPRPLIDVILKRYDQKCRLKNATTDYEKNEYSLAKQFINSIYGMTVTSPLDSDIIYNNGVWKVEQGDPETLLKKHKMSSRYCLAYSVGVFVTAWARWELLRTVNAIGDDAIYCDTDSIKLRNADEHKHIIDEYNEQNKQELFAAMDFHKIDREKVCPLGKWLGIFEYEGTYDEFKTLGAKRYCYTDENGENFNYTVAGLSKSKTEKELAKMNEEERKRYEHSPRKYMENLTANKVDVSVFDVFDFDLEVPADWSNKMASVYNVMPWRKFVTDYTGRRAECSELFGVALEPIAYKMKISPAFLAFLSDTENDAEKYRGGIGTKPECLKITPLD